MCIGGVGIVLCLLMAISLTGCGLNFSFDIPPRQQIIPPPGDKIVIEGDKEIVEPIQSTPMCQARARFFRGTVSVPGSEIGGTIAP